MKRLLTIQDISCVGKCSLTEALPVISSMGIETCVLPTAVLSTHTAFRNFRIRDLTEDMGSFMDIWKKEGILFDTVYSGYLGSADQIDLVLRAASEFRAEGARLIVDPAMADGGRLYSGFDDRFVEKMRRLCAAADVIVPNLTEACLLAGMPYRENAGADYLQEIMERLSAAGTPDIIITGAQSGSGEVGAMSRCGAEGKCFLYTRKKFPVSYHGTGDLFASCLSGALTLGMSLREAAALSVDFDWECIRETIKDPDRRIYGVSFERALPWLIRRIQGRDTTDTGETEWAKRRK